MCPISSIGSLYQITMASALVFLEVSWIRVRALYSIQILGGKLLDSDAQKCLEPLYPFLPISLSSFSLPHFEEYLGLSVQIFEER